MDKFGGIDATVGTVVSATSRVVRARKYGPKAVPIDCESMNQNGAKAQLECGDV